jgi:hypothetical protein
MRLFIFKSDTNKKLRAFAGDLTGSRLPQRHGPWHAIGAVAPEAALPHKFERAPIEQAIEEHGFQLWRFKPTAKPAAKTAAAKPAAAG